MVEVYQLGRIAERSGGGAKSGMVATWAAVQQVQHGLFDQLAPALGEARTLDVKVQGGLANLGKHRRGPERRNEVRTLGQPRSATVRQARDSGGTG
jgi:hypothetical protein